MIGVSSMTNRRSPQVFFAALAAMAVVLVGCGNGAPRGKIQVQFHSPAGAMMLVKGVQDDEPIEARSRGPLGGRLSRFDDELAVFDLRPGRYSVAYTGASGAEDSIIYGDLEVFGPTRDVTRRFCQYSMVPIKLPSLQPEAGEHLFPVRDLSYTVGLEGREFKHIKQGDLITKVYFVADLEQVRRDYEVEYREKIAQLDGELSVLADQELYVENRYRQERRKALQRDPEMNYQDRAAHARFDKWGVEERYIKLAKKKYELAAQRERLQAQRTRLEAERHRRHVLLRSLNIIHRDGALVLATPDLQIPYTNTVEQVSELGDVLAVLHVGGRHQYWAKPVLAAARVEATDESTP
jgi:hypothetical protein